ncbi:MAG: arsenate reductase ArsC, partial [Nitrosopumilaceae archaeon]
SGLKNFQATSAGTQPSPEINPVVVQAMNEIGIDISNQTPKLISDEMIKESTAVNMGCMDKESCPALFVKDTIYWQIPDPKGKSIEEVRKIRDTIQSNVKKLVLQFQEEQ